MKFTLIGNKGLNDFPTCEVSEIWNDCPICQNPLLYIEEDLIGLCKIGCQKCNKYEVHFSIGRSFNIIFDTIINEKYIIDRSENICHIYLPNGNELTSINMVLSIEDCLNIEKIKSLILLS